MRKPDIFDEIIQCLKTGASIGADASMSEETLHDLYARPRRAAAPSPVPAASSPAPTVASVRQDVRVPQPQQPSAVPAYAPDLPEWESLRTECASCMKCPLGRTRTHMVFADVWRVGAPC